ncbi:hypothetical protein AAVH_15885 [Aphelenchoides avenae]|nr:hypothetical protein AAVH_15885 [Aphelenchus avenae]
MTHARAELDSALQDPTTSVAEKNLLYNKRLFDYMKLRKEAQDRPVKVEMTNAPAVAPNSKRKSAQTPKTPLNAAAHPETPRTRKRGGRAQQQPPSQPEDVQQLLALIAKNPLECGVDEKGRIMNFNKRLVARSNVVESVMHLLHPRPFAPMPPGTDELRTRLATRPETRSFIATGQPPDPEVQEGEGEARRHDPTITRKDVVDFLERERTYTLHRKRRVRYKRLRTVPSGFMTDVQVDLMDFQKFAAENDGHAYALLAVDVMSRRIFVVPVKTKHSTSSAKNITPSMKAAFTALFEQMPCLPWKVFSDKGTEFESCPMKAFFKQMDILKHVSQSDDTKACVAERAIQTLKRRLYRYLSHNRTKRWLDVLPSIVAAINRTKCRVTGMRPVDMNERNWQPVWRRLYSDSYTPQKQDTRYKSGTTVRMDVAKKTFEKGYLPNFSREVFKIKRVRPGNPTTYALEDTTGEAILGKFYAPNFSRAHPVTKRIDRVWQTRKRRGRTQYFVSWMDENPDVGMSSKQFVVILPSNTPGADNTTNRYVVQLPKKLEFNGSWQCALHSISYRQSWPAIGTGHDVYIDVALQAGTTDRVEVPKGSYAAPDALAEVLNASLQPYSVRIEYVAHIQRYKIHLDADAVKYVAMSKQMYYVLGYRPTQKIRSGDLAEHPPDLQGGISHFAVYTNITQPMVVGDCMAQMLRVVTVTGKPGQTAERIFDSPIYCSVSSREISKILIDIRTLDNKPILFSAGDVIYTSEVSINDIQFGAGAYFTGVPFQRGGGIGGTLMRFWRFLVPLVKPIAKEIGKEGMHAGARILENVADGQRVSDAVVEQGRQSVRNLARRVQRGDGVKRRRSKIDSASQNSVSSSLAIFDTPPTNVTATSAMYKEILTLNPVSTHPFHFRISPGSSFVDLSKCYLTTQMRIRKRNDDGSWENLPADAKVVPAQYIGATFIENMKVSINGREVFHSNGHYAYKAFLDSELSYSHEYKRAVLSGAGWFPAEDQEDADDESFVRRQKLFKESETVELFSRIHADVFCQDRLVINGVDIDIEITPQHDDKFTVIAHDAGIYKLEILGCRLYAKMLNLTEGLNLSIASRLATQPARYPVRRSHLKSETINAGLRDFHSMLFTELIPRRIIVGFVDTGAFSGDYRKSPFNFKNFSIRDITISAHGQIYPNVAYDLKWTTCSKHARPFLDMHEAVGLRPPDSNGITLEMFNSGWTLFVFNLSTTLDNDDGYDMIRTGTCHIDVKFHTETPAAGIQMIVYGESESLLLIDHTRTVSSDLTV